MRTGGRITFAIMVSTVVLVYAGFALPAQLAARRACVLHGWCLRSFAFWHALAMWASATRLQRGGLSSDGRPRRAGCPPSS